MPEARERGYKKGRFSFNGKEGRCPNCEGQGFHLIEMHFLSDVWVKCDQCKGKRYNRETLAVSYKGFTIADVLEMEISQALEVFSSQPRIKRILKTMEEVGMGYMKLGQAGNTLSGGEAQRLKLSTELARRLEAQHFIFWMSQPRVCMWMMWQDCLKFYTVWWIKVILCLLLNII
ncbi:MAG: hypothetical protein CM1200mP28_08990 [Deltaproteobacteria bacterium]|nr:MAG: hypothetical protein CM1200mP28_08990 [Deltaproteobacteria bacterium]